jgi:23S rRNA pseudouridine955/2504/2580 synthase/23S rRNA pseudouridine1911/1915/1917 synthase
MKRPPTIQIHAHEAGLQVLELLAARFTYRSRDDWARIIRSGLLLVNGRPANGFQVLRTGDTLCDHTPRPPEPPVNPRYSIVFQDPAILVINKPPNLPCHPAGRYGEHTLWSLLRSRLAEPYLVLVNRLDRETSGIVLLAKTPEAARSLRDQFQRRRVFKRYVAVVEGRFPQKRISARGSLIPDSLSPIRKRWRFSRALSETEDPQWGKSCHTVFDHAQVFGDLSRVEAFPETGRSHQIRATLFGLGYPVVGDKIYGKDDTLFVRFINGQLTAQDTKQLRLGRQALHAAELVIRHPETGKDMRFLAPVPSDMQGLLDP